MSEKPRETKIAKPDEAVTASPKFGRRMIAGFLVMQLAISVMTIGIYDRFFAQKVAVLDVNKYIASLRTDYVAGKINSEALKQAPKKIKQAVDSVGSNTIILLGEAVLKNGEYIKIEN